MNHLALCRIVVIGLVASLTSGAAARSENADPSSSNSIRVGGWSLQSSTNVAQSGETLSVPSYQAEAWHAAVVPGTVIASLVHDKTIPDPYFGVNLRNLIGSKFRNDKILAEMPMDMTGQFAVPWWYRSTFNVPDSYKGKVIWLHFGGINYRADIWINGHRLADADTTVGTWRIYDFNVTDLVRPGAQNAIAVRVYPPTKTDDLAISYVDWNPGFPDRYMGLFREVSLSATGPVAMRYPAVNTQFDLPDTTTAHLTVVAQLINSTDRTQTGTLHGGIGEIEFAQQIELKPNETKDVVLDPGAFPQLNLHNPRLWWPAQMGQPNLYILRLKFVMNGEVSDSGDTRFGVREITSELDANNYRLFRVNGKRLLIRGGAWSMDEMMQKSKQRLEDEFAYIHDMGLNAIRQEGMFETDDFFDIADEKGILVLPGITCSLWETWPKWQKEQLDVAANSVRSQILRMRSHPSLLAWLNGSDNPPPAEIEKMYLAIERQYLWPNPVLSNASEQSTTVTGESGVKMTGPYDYVVPEFWTEEKDPKSDSGGAFGFNTETGPGPSIPPIETLREILPKEHLWPVDDWWNFHAGQVDFTDLHVFIHCLDERYGKATSLDDFLMKSQLMRYEAIRAMYEGYSRNKYQTATGVIGWMLNNPWPSLIWNLYDYNLRTAGGYFGTKLSLEPLHPLYAYDDNAVWVVSSQYTDADKLTVTAQIFDLNMKERFSKQASLNAGADSTNRVFTLPEIPDLTPVYFLKLALTDESGNLVGSNFYWLTNKPETVTHGVINNGNGYARDFADFRPLSELKRVAVKASAATGEENGSSVTRVIVKNDNATLAFFVHFKLSRCGSDQDIVPTLWSDNYISLVPGESREVTAVVRNSRAAQVRVDVDGWNVDHISAGCTQEE